MFITAGTMAALVITSLLITKFKQVRFLVIYPAISLIMLILVYVVKSPIICYVGAFVIGVVLALFVNLRYGKLLAPTEK